MPGKKFTCNTVGQHLGCAQARCLVSSFPTQLVIFYDSLRLLTHNYGTLLCMRPH